ncbi:hypothetical protein AB5J56_02335 [Streptomyces sp. R21]|uniref:Uncharacterized protein n=1 Tax=Streptomyces sp. R21 TaxID=3238627 RepID=A0AB39PPY3_9ACTN
MSTAPLESPTTVVKIGSTYHAFLKSTSTKSIDFATSSSLTGPWTITKTGNRVWADDRLRARPKVSRSGPG